MDDANDTLLPTREVRKRYHVSDTWLDRQLASDADMPRPIYIGNRRYWRLSELVAWENSRPRVPPESSTARRPPLRRGVRAAGDRNTADAG